MNRMDMEKLTSQFFDQSSVHKLKTQLRFLNLSTVGNKTTLMIRLQNAWRELDYEIVKSNIEKGLNFDLEDGQGESPKRQFATEENIIAADKEVIETNATSNQILLEELNRELISVQDLINKRKEINELKRQLAVLNEEEDVAARNNYFGFNDIENSLQHFTGDDELPVEKWVQSFEENAEILQWDEKSKFIYAKRLMRGTAKLFLRTVTASTWTGFKYKLLKEFNKKVSNADIHRKLQLRKKRQDETLHQYLLSMQEIAACGEVEDSDIVQYVITGINDTETNKFLLYQANTIDELKRALRKYEIFKFNQKPHQQNLSYRQNQNIKSNQNPKSNFYASRYRNSNGDKYSHQDTGQKLVRSKKPQGSEHSELKCFNCNKPGHLIAACPLPRRERGSCYACGEKDHLSKDCPNKIMVVEKDADKGNVSGNSIRQNILNLFSNKPLNEFNDDFECKVQLELISDGNYIKFYTSIAALLDTGSPISFVKRKFIPPAMQVDANNCEHPKFSGINKSQLRIVGQVNCNVKIENIFVNIKLFVVEDNSMSYHCILGRDFIGKTRMKLTVQRNENNYENFGKPEKENLCVTRLRPTSECMEFTEAVSEIMSIEVYDDQVSPSNFDFNEALPYDVKCQLIEILTEGRITSECNLEPETTVKMHIRLNKEVPFACAPRRLSYFHKEELRKIINDLLTKGIIRESESPYASPIVLVRKRNKELRLCVDYRQLNKLTDKCNYPLPLIEDLLDQLNKKKYFTTLDLKNGFHHVSMAEDSIKYTSFVTPLGQFEYLKMPFGLKNAPAIFQKYINYIFKDLISSNKILVYLDDLLIATDTIDEHLRILKEVINIASKHNLKFRFDKCRFLYNEIQFLGYTINYDGIKPNLESVKAVERFPTPKNIRELHSFVGLCSYFRKFIDRFAIIAKPLYDLLRKNVTFEFGPDQLESFNMLKSKLISAPVLAVFSPGSETELHCDASSVGFGAILMQKQPDSKFHPVFYFSKRTTDTESRYHSYELETLSIIYALRRFRTYLLGMKFKIIIDCRSLTLTLEKKLLNPRISRWALELQEFDYVIEHRSGSRMQHADALSRSSNILLIHDNSFESELAVRQLRDPVIKAIASSLEKKQSSLYELVNGLVYRKVDNELLFYVPSVMENNMIRTHHESLCHLGVDKCYEFLRKSYWFPKMKEKIKQYVSDCLRCIEYSPSAGRKEGQLHNIPKGDRPFDTIHVDHYGPLPTTLSRKKYIFLIVDGFTKFTKLYAVNSTSTKEVEKCLELYFSTYSRPSRIVSDRGTCFISEEFSNFIRTHNISHIKVATQSPQSNGQVERINRILTPMLSKESSDTTSGDWHKNLTKVEYALNNTVNRSTGYTPSYLLFGINQKGPVCDKIMEYIDEVGPCKRFERNLEEVRGKASQNIERNQRINKNYYDSKHKAPRRYEKGDYVVVKNVVNIPGVNKKLLPKYKGPYEIIEVLNNDRYVVADIEGHQVGRKPNKGITSPANMKPYLESLNS